MEAHPIEVTHAEDGGRGAFYVGRDGVRIAQMTYVRHTPTLATLDHTEVDDSLRGLGVGRKLLDALVAWARRGGTRFHVTCPYAKAQFEKDPSIRDVLAGG